MIVAGLTAVGMAAGATACSVPSSEMARPGTCDPFQLTDVLPPSDSTGVPPNVVPIVTFSDFPNPDTITVSTIALYTGFFYHTGRYWVELVERRALFQPSGDLAPGLGYTLVLRPGIRSLRGCRLEDPPTGADGEPSDIYAFRFRIAEPGTPRAPTPVSSTANYGQVIDLFAAHCAGSTCHLDRDQPPNQPEACLASAAGKLSLCGRDAYDSLVGVPSTQVTRLARVAPRDSSRSYLLRKLIGAPPVVGHAGVPQDDLSRDDLHIIESWIDTGATR